MESLNETKSENDTPKKSHKFVKKISLEEDLFMKIKPKIVFKGPFRYIVPYPYVYKSFVKQRWENRTIVEVFSKEFRSDPLEYYVFIFFFCNYQHFSFISEKSYRFRKN